MFCTTRDVERLTGYAVTQDVLNRAQAILEVYVGRIEQDVTNMRDHSLLGRALAYQAAYMRDNAEQIFEQVMVQQSGQNDSLTTYKANDMTAPWIAPLAVMACKKLSWTKSRSVHTGRVFQKGFAGYFNKASAVNWWND